jgi:hypothetical protein
MEQHDAVGHASADHEYLETPPGSTYEHTDANVWIIVKFLIWLAVSAVIIHVGLGMVYELLIQQSMEVGEQRTRWLPPRASACPDTEAAAVPRNGSISSVRAKRASFATTADEQNAGIVHIPIEDAMRLAVERGLPSRARKAARRLRRPG